MPVYVDPLQRCIPNRRWCHEYACHLLPHDQSPVSIEDLHAFAAKLGLKRCWFQTRSLPHYDLTSGKRRQALQHGAVDLNTVESLRDAYGRLRRRERLYAR